ncbi:hypothetical protein M8818_003333 [Zalaria obscura]|uniref:Uncharacterized protein n=1 Tax=Zalaria obscura TaxID=2024903 RepID=A0ACC3SFT5_9PEZI
MDAMSNRTMDKGHVVINEDNVRRSDRLKTTELNGRGYLSDQMGCTVFKFEEWMKSSSVLPHLLQWDKLCIKGVSRYNDVVDKINSGEFYDVEEFEDDLILACLSENHEHSARFTAPHIITCDWTTSGYSHLLTCRQIAAYSSEDMASFAALPDEIILQILSCTSREPQTTPPGQTS